MVGGRNVFLIAMVLLAGCSVVFAQEAIGAGKVELGGFPGGGTFFTGGNDNTEANFNVYTAGGDLTYYLNSNVAVEAEMTGSVGWAQDIFYGNEKVIHNQMPGVWSQTGNIVVFPGGAKGKRYPFYVTGGAGLLELQSRVPTQRFGYDVATVGWQSFMAENIGAGLKIYRGSDAPNWGFRIDYRMLFINSKSSAPAFFAQSENRTGSRIYVGMLYTWKR
jgi:hypothetical protein